MKKLIDIIHLLGDKNYPLIEFRCEYTKNDIEYDTYFGACSYDAEKGQLIPFDDDWYSLDSQYEDWAEWENDDGETCLTVWEYAD